MSKQSNIRWRKSDIEKLRKQTRNFNAKVDYHTEKGRDYLPEKVSTKDLKDTIKTRADYKRIMNELESFSKKGAEKAVQNKNGLIVSQWELDTMKKHYNAFEREKATLLKQYMNEQATDRGKPLNFKRGEMGTERADELRARQPFDFNKFTSAKDFEKFNKYLNAKIMKNSRYETDLKMLNNYIQGVTDIFGDNAKALIAKLQSLKPEQFVKNYMKDEQASFEFLHYDLTEQNAKLNYLHKVWGVENVEGDLYDEYDPDEEEY
jgi:hypothetical protein